MAHHAPMDSEDMAASKFAATIAEKDVIEAAKEAFVCPPGYRRCLVPTGESRSCMYDYGVKVEEIEPTSEIPTDPSKRRKVIFLVFSLFCYITLLYQMSLLELEVKSDVRK